MRLITSLLRRNPLSPMPPGIEVTPEDITAVAADLRLDLADAEKVAILSALKSCDIQAGPGSGKTTILTAKLAILAKKWPFRDRGICVLSHTNVARREIEDRLGQSAGLRRLLNYPHFIGTFQTFVDRFIAVPFLRNLGVEVTTVDNEKFASRASSLFQLGQFGKARYTLRTRYKTRPERVDEIIGGLRFEGAQLAVTHPAAGENRFPGASSDTGKALIKLKEMLREDGYFRFDDMYAFAEACLAKLGYVTPVLRRRFPWVLVDELQDTSDSQDRIVEHLFGVEDCVLQKFGDKNQAIFNNDHSAVEAPKLFGRRTTLPLSATYRFGQQIAKFASSMTVVTKQDLNGHPDRPDQANTVFIFDRDACGLVIPAFGDLVLSELSDKVLDDREVCVVGSRKNERQLNKDHFPMSLRDYWKDFVSDVATKPAIPDSMLGFFLEARKKSAADGMSAEGYSIVLSGILAFLRRVGPEIGIGLPEKKRDFREWLVQSGRWAIVQQILWTLIRPDQTLAEPMWRKNMGRLLVTLVGTEWKKIARTTLEFLKWVPPAALEVPQPDNEPNGRKKTNVFIHRSGDRILPIRLDSIHGVKGETHAATLVVETFMNKQHDAHALLPVLTGAKHGSQLTGGAIGHGKRWFVGMSRPTHLLCLALFRERINDGELAALEARQWRIRFVKL